MQSWQTDWDEFNQKAAVPRQQTESSTVAKFSIWNTPWHACKSALNRLGQERESQNDDEAMEALATLREDLELANDASEVLSEKLHSLEGDVTNLRSQRRERQEQLNDMRSKLQIQRGREASLDALQQAAKERVEGGKVGDWLRQRGLSENPRLLDDLQVEPRWQGAVEVVLGGALQGVCVDSVETLDEALGELASGDLTLFEPGCRWLLCRGFSCAQAAG